MSSPFFQTLGAIFIVFTSLPAICYLRLLFYRHSHTTKVRKKRTFLKTRSAAVCDVQAKILPYGKPKQKRKASSRSPPLVLHLGHSYRILMNDVVSSSRETKVVLPTVTVTITGDSPAPSR